MKKLLLSAAMLAGLSALGAAPAMAQATGFVGVSVGSLNLDVGPADNDVDLMGAHGSVSFPVGQGLILQGNLAFDHLDDPVDGDNVSGSANFGMRNANYALGAYIATKNSDSVIDDTFLGFGGEYVYYMPQMTLSIGGGFGKFDDADADLYGVSGVGRYFVSDNFRIDGKVGYTNLDDGGESDGIGAGIGAEWKPDNFPISIFGGYDFQTLDAGTADLDISVWQIGARFDFGNGTLKARDRSGPAFRPAAGLDTAANGLF